MSTNPAVAKNDEGVRLLDSGDYEGAVAAFTEAIDLNPDFKTAYRNRSQALRKLGRMAEANSDFDRQQKISRGPGFKEPGPPMTPGLVGIIVGVMISSLLFVVILGNLMHIDYVIMMSLFLVPLIVA